MTETNPRSHEFCIRLFICTNALLPDSSFRDLSLACRVQKKNAKQSMCTFWSDAKVHVIIPPKSKKSGVIMKLLQGWLLYWHLFFKEQQTEKGSARHILCLCGVIYEAWNWIPWSSRHSTVTTWQSESEGWQSGSQYRHMHADRKIYAQTEIHSEQNTPKPSVI